MNGFSATYEKFSLEGLTFNELHQDVLEYFKEIELGEISPELYEDVEVILEAYESNRSHFSAILYSCCKELSNSILGYHKIEEFKDFEVTSAMYFIILKYFQQKCERKAYTLFKVS